jgi:hypothetical protein
MLFAREFRREDAAPIADGLLRFEDGSSVERAVLPIEDVGELVQHHVAPVVGVRVRGPHGVP